MSINPAALGALLQDLSDIPHEADAAVLRIRSRDRFAISPMLRGLLKDKAADVILAPRSKEELRRIAAAAFGHRIPIIPRGGGTANFGQSVPLQGGILLDMTGLAGVLWQRPGIVRALAGTLIGAMDDATRPQGWEQRIHPSTKKASTIAGFLGGGHAGVGSCAFGMLRDPGNVLGVEVMSVAAEPRPLELRGADVELVLHAYGSNAIITEVEMPTAPAYEWLELVCAFQDHDAAVACALQLAHADGMGRKLISLQEAPLPALIAPLAPLLPPGAHMLNLLVAAPFLEAMRHMLEAHGGVLCSTAREGEGPYGAPLYEFSWGHTLLNIQRSQRDRTGVLGLFSGEDVAGMIRRVRARSAGQDMPLRLEFERLDGRPAALGSPISRFAGQEGMAALVRLLEEEGVLVANSHAVGVKAVGMKRITARDIAFKREMDPAGLLNPGKLDFSDAADAGAALGTSGWRRA
ncbi:MAG: FAD-binding oxidoreductase [Alphaproteobacteria bacterium]|nr:FAD-binding oxidoreductase [Alphaproteobacteria bacterium]